MRREFSANLRTWQKLNPVFLFLVFFWTARPARFARMCDVGARGFRLLGLALSLALGLAWGLAFKAHGSPCLEAR